ncbi:restriction endonuclease subunit S [Salegentibacter sp. LM13S]|uniref:restriction endonuclease subunit S n=1 Tax=Salegentibacter lacus TaxID=2873599 RepID=UPI001CD01346|nr:restriction endonuclease subunit S [Salegentibacter lacus]MBZ9631618.1 restriction endonuclease subunit S [Salegentibacter lacus]
MTTIAAKEVKPGYKKTKLGWIPEDWEILELGDIGTFKNGINKDKDQFGFGYPFVSLNDVFQINDSEEKKLPLVNSTEKDRKNYNLKTGDVLFVRSSVKPEGVGLTSVVQSDLSNTVFSGFIIRFRGNKYLSTQFKKHCFSEARFRNRLLNKSTISANTNINQQALNSLSLIVPPLKEQTRIAEVLNCLNSPIIKVEKLIERKKTLKKGLMQQLLTGKKRLTGFNGEWKEYSYKELLTEVKRNFEWKDSAEYDLISVRRRSGGLFHRESLFGHQIKTKNLRTAQAEDFLISKMQIVHGASGLTTEDFDGMKISGSYIALVSRDKKILNINFLNWYSKLPQFYHQCYISSYGVHIEKMTFDFKLFLKEKISIPGTEEQMAITKVLEASQQEIDLLKKKKEMLQNQKKGLMQQLLTGKKRLEAN